jgi:asparagine synthase (glutamine-hydrolysing)
MPPDRTVRLVAGMNRAQAHRGPDGEGIWNGDRAVLGHRRLAIIDLSDNAKQPMANEDGSLILVVNGEIYNYKQLFEELQRKGHTFRSRSDSETILHLYEEVGDECVTHLTGMFAFALWDAKRRRLLLARDRIGEKPLHYTLINGGIAFASEAKALLTLPGVDAALDEEAMTSFLVYHSPPAPLTFFKGIRALEPAAFMVWENGRIRTPQRYWKIDFSAVDRRWTWDDALARYDELLTESVDGCLLADVPVGIYLSGGVDSSTIAVKSAKRRHDIATFCIGRDAPENPDPEFRRALRVAGLLNLPHHNLTFDSADVVKLPFALSYYDQPFYELRVLLDGQLAAAARRTVKVALAGAGADEVFAGYAHYHQVRLASLFARAAGVIPQTLISALPGDDCAKWKTFAHAARLPMTHWKGAMLDREKDMLARRLFTPEFYKISAQYSPGRVANDYCEECSPRHYLDATLYFQLMAFNQHATTVLSDGAGMSNGLEIRAPFLNHKLIEFAASLPIDFLVPSLTNSKYNKAIMKKWLVSHLPEDVVYARKLGFGYAITYKTLLSGAWRLAAEALAANGRYLELGIFSRRAARLAVDEGSLTAFMLLVFSIWAEMYLFGETASSVSETIAKAGRPADGRVPGHDC